MLNDLLRLLRYSVIRLWKMKFLLPVIEIFCHKLKYLNNPMEFLKFFSYSGRAYRTLDPTPPQPVMLNGRVRMLRSRVIRLWKMKFLLPVIEKFCHKLKYLNNPMEFLKVFSDSGRAYRTLEPSPPPRPVMLNYLLKLLRYRVIRLWKMKFL